MRKVDKKLKNFISDCIDEACHNIKLEHYWISTLYMKDESQFDDGKIVAASMTTDRRYLKATLKIFLHVEDMWKRGEKEEIQEIIHHEIAHIATQHLMDCAQARYCETGEMKDAWETLTEVVGRLSIRLQRK